MTSTPGRTVFLLSLALLPLALFGQRTHQPVDSVLVQPKRTPTYERAIQFSLFPGISTNGLYSASFRNKFSFNLFGGLSAANRILEVSPVSNLNLQSTTGIQIAGLANIIGANAFVNLTSSEEWALIRDGFNSGSKGIQMSGLLNYVRDDASGIQFTGGLNVVGRDFTGVRLSGMGNAAGGRVEGFQLASLYNIAHESMAGFQFSAFFNHTNGQLSGTQVALINKSTSIKGKKTAPPSRARGLQFGLVNFCKSMYGTQIGLINFGGAVLGRQFGLINFFSKYPTKENVKLGTSIGLLNFGSRGPHFRIYSNEIFATNLEYSTGNCLNCSPTMSEMPYDDNNQVFFQNVLILGYDPITDNWGFGYGFQKVLYNKAVMFLSPKNGNRVINYGLRFLHLNRSMTFDRAFNLLTKLNIDYGKRKGPVHVFASLSLNYFMHQEDEVFEVRSVSISARKVFNLRSDFWPGYGVGFQF